MMCLATRAGRGRASTLPESYWHLTSAQYQKRQKRSTGHSWAAQQTDTKDTHRRLSWICLGSFMKRWIQPRFLAPQPPSPVSLYYWQAHTSLFHTGAPLFEGKNKLFLGLCKALIMARLMFAGDSVPHPLHQRHVRDTLPPWVNRQLTHMKSTSYWTWNLLLSTLPVRLQPVFWKTLHRLL